MSRTLDAWTFAAPAARPNKTALDGPPVAEPETGAAGVEAEPELRDAVDGAEACTPAPLLVVDVRLVPGTVVGKDGTFTGGSGTGGVLTGGSGTGAVVTVGTVTDGTVTLATGTDGVVIPGTATVTEGTETVTDGTVSATLARGNAPQIKSSTTADEAIPVVQRAAHHRHRAAPCLSRLATGLPLIATHIYPSRTNSNRPLRNKATSTRTARRMARTPFGILPVQMVADVTIGITVAVDDPRASSRLLGHAALGSWP